MTKKRRSREEYLAFAQDMLETKRDDMYTARGDRAHMASSHKPRQAMMPQGKQAKGR